MTRRTRRVGIPGQSAPAPSLGARDPRVRTNAQTQASRRPARGGVRMEDDGAVVFNAGAGLEVGDDESVNVVVEFPLVLG